MPGPAPVLLISQFLAHGGTERQLTELARALDRARFQPHVACFRSPGARAAELRAAGVPVLALGLDSFRPPRSLEAARRLRAYVREHGIRLAHAFDTPAALFAVPVLRAWTRAAILSSQRAHRDLAGQGWRRPLLRLTDRLVDGIVVNCRYLERHLVEDERVPPELISVCYNGIDAARFRAGERPRAPAAIGTMCVLRPEKDLGTLLEAFARVRGGHPGTRLVIAGDGPARPALEARAATLGLGDTCRFAGAIGDVAEWLRGIDLFVLPSLSEALSNSLMEAMAAGCCAIASRVGGNPELVEEGRTGLLFRAGDAGDLARALADALRDPVGRRRLGAAAARDMRERFSLSAAAERLAQVYARTLGQAPPRARAAAAGG